MVTSACRPPPMKSAMAVLAQVAAERLGVNLGSVRVEVGDSRFPPAPVAGGSNTTASTCSAVLKACDVIREKLFQAVSTLNERTVGAGIVAEPTLSEGRIFKSDGEAVSLGDAFKRLGVSALEEYAEY